MRRHKTNTEDGLKVLVVSFVLSAVVGFYAFSLFGGSLTQRFLHAMGAHDEYAVDQFYGYEEDGLAQAEATELPAEENNESGCTCPICCQI
jgi:hypothetical protein